MAVITFNDHYFFDSDMYYIKVYIRGQVDK